MKIAVCFFFIYLGISFLGYFNREEVSINGFISNFLVSAPYHCLAFSIMATCLCVSLNPFVVIQKGRRSALATIISASTVLGIAASVCNIQSHPDGAWRFREQIETEKFYMPGMFIFPDSAPAHISKDLKSEKEIKYARDVLFLSKLYFWKSCLDFAPPFLLASWLYGVFIFALIQNRFFRSQPRITAKV